MRCALLVVAACGGGAVVSAPPPPAPAPREIVERLVETVEPKELIVDGDTLYWIGGGDKPGIYTAPLTAGAASTQLFEVADARALTVQGDHLAWTDRRVTGPFPIFRGPRAGGAVTIMIELPDPVWSMVDAGGLIAGSYQLRAPGGSKIYTISPSGDVTELASLEGKTPELVRGRDGLYVGTSLAVEGGKAAIVRLDGTRGPVALYAGAARQLAIGRDAIYFLDHPRDADTLYRLDGKVAKQLATGKFVNHLAEDDDYVYWSDDRPAASGALFRLRKTGGEPEHIAEVGDITALHVVGPYLYWSDARLDHIARLGR